MQEASLEQATGRKDVILLSPTGSGKTLAYLLPLLLTLKPNDDSVQVLILVPSRELALQIDSVFKAMGTSWKTCCCYGGHPIAEEKKSILSNHPAIIIGTPGRITDHLSKGNFNPETIETLIIDEFDKSLEFGFHDEMAEIITQLPGLKKRMLLSATDAAEIPEFTGLNRTVKLNFLSDDSEEQESRLKLMKVLSPSKDKIDTLYNLLCTLGSASSIVFCNHRDAVDRVHQLLADKKLLAERFHGGMEQPDRERALYKFRNGSCHVLISTDLAARGLDIPEVGHIIHYHLPVNEEAFTHRNGRTARWDATGTSYLILHAEEKLPSYILEEMGLEGCGAHGTTAALAMLNDAVKKGGVMASSRVGGLSGAFIPVSEDAGMIAAAENGYLDITKLESMTAVCSVGLDMIVVPGDTSADVISAVIADEAAIGMVNTKTTAVRLIPAIGKKAGDTLNFGGLLGYGPVMELRKGSPAKFINRGGQIPAPLQALKN